MDTLKSLTIHSSFSEEDAKYLEKRMKSFISKLEVEEDCIIANLRTIVSLPSDLSVVRQFRPTRFIIFYLHGKDNNYDSTRSCDSDLCCNLNHLNIYEIKFENRRSTILADITDILIQNKEYYLDLINKHSILESISGIDSKIECKLWTHTKMKHEFGSINIKGQKLSVNNVVWTLNHGKYPTRNEHIRNTCENKLCCNISHLFMSNDYKLRIPSIKTTMSESEIQEKLESQPEPKTQIKLKDQDALEVAELLKVGTPVSKITKKLGFTEYTIKQIRDGKKWTHIGIDTSEFIPYIGERSGREATKLSDEKMLELAIKFRETDSIKSISDSTEVSSLILSRIRDKEKAEWERLEIDASEFKRKDFLTLTQFSCIERCLKIKNNPTSIKTVASSLQINSLLVEKVSKGATFEDLKFKFQGTKRKC
jgi:predicted transcriptional regulator